MKKIFFGLIVLALFLIGGCSPAKQVCYQREVKYTEGVASAGCTEKTIEYEISNQQNSIKPYPSQAQHQYDVGIMDFTILNKDKSVDGYFNLSMECVMPSSDNTKETTSIFLAAGELKKVEFKCSKRGLINALNGPFVDSAPTTENCPAAGSAPVEKVRYETVCQ